MPNAGDDAEQARQRHRFVEARQPAADEVADRRSPETTRPSSGPPTRAGRQLGHRAQADRAERQFAEGVQQIGDDQPHGLTLHAARRELGGDDRMAKPAPTNISPSANFAGLDGSRGAQPDPEPREHRRQHDDEQRLQRLEPAARKLPAEDRCSCGAIGEQVERRAGLLELRPEERRGEEAARRSRTVASARPASSRRPENSQPKKTTVRTTSDIAGGVGNLLSR